LYAGRQPSAPSDGTSTGMGATAGGYFVWFSVDGLDGLNLPNG
jgi:hypothetical protein